MQIEKKNNEVRDDRNSNVSDSTQLLRVLPISRTKRSHLHVLRDTLDILRLGFIGLVVPCVAFAAFMMFVVWLGLLGYVPALLPFPWAAIIIWTPTLILMVFAFAVDYARTH